MTRKTVSPANIYQITTVLFVFFKMAHIDPFTNMTWWWLLFIFMIHWANNILLLFKFEITDFLIAKIWTWYTMRKIGRIRKKFREADLKMANNEK